MCVRMAVCMCVFLSAVMLCNDICGDFPDIFIHIQFLYKFKPVLLISILRVGFLIRAVNNSNYFFSSLTLQLGDVGR